MSDDTVKKLTDRACNLIKGNPAGSISCELSPTGKLTCLDKTQLKIYGYGMRHAIDQMKAVRDE